MHTEFTFQMNTPQRQVSSTTVNGRPMQAYRRHGRKAPSILHVSPTGVGRLTHQPFYPWEKSPRYPL